MDSRRKKRGFTLVELLVVVSIIGLLATLVVVHLSGASELAEQKLAVTEIARLKQATQLYRRIHKSYPDSLDALFKPDPKYSNKPWVDGTNEDPWGKPYKYEKTRNGFVIRTLGADGVAGGEGVNADIDSDNLHDFK